MTPQQSQNGIKLMSKIVGLAEQRPVVAIVLALIVMGIFMGGGSFAASFFGLGSSVAKELATLQQKTITLSSEIRAERKARIEEITRLKEDGKLQSDSDIQVQIGKTLNEFETRFFTRLNLLGLKFD